jgi:hypothetical protein
MPSEEVATADVTDEVDAADAVDESIEDSVDESVESPQAPEAEAPEEPEADEASDTPENTDMGRQREAFRSALALTLDQVRTELDVRAAREDGTGARAAAELGRFAAGRIDPERFAALTSASASDDDSWLEPARRALETLRAVKARGDRLFSAAVGPGGDLYAAGPSARRASSSLPARASTWRRSTTRCSPASPSAAGRRPSAPRRRRSSWKWTARTSWWAVSPASWTER